MTIKDIAREANVSTATVSNVLTKKKYVSAELEKRVLKIIAKMNYRPNSYARNLKVNRSQNIGVMVPDITNPFFGEIVKHIQIMATQMDYEITLFNSDNTLHTEKDIIERLLCVRVDGIINIAPRMTNIELEKIGDIPMVIVDRPAFATEANFAFVYADNYKGAGQVANYFVEKGHENFLCFAGPVKSVINAKSRAKGFLDGLKQCGIAQCQWELIDCDFTFDEGYMAMELFVKKMDKTKRYAAFISSDIMAWGAMEALKTHNIKVPKQIAIIGYDNISYSNYLYPKLTTVENPTKELGINAARLIIDALTTKNKLRGISMVLQSPLIERQST